MNVLSVTSECYPLVKTGGLADVTGALPLALAAIDVDQRVLLPAYMGVLDEIEGGRTVAQISDLFGGDASLVEGTTSAGLNMLLIDAPHLYDRAGGPYSDPTGADWPDNHLRYAALSWVAAEIACGRVGKWRPHVVHVHDWHAALTAAYLHFEASAARPATLLTIHNLAYQGLFPKATLGELRLPEDALAEGGMGHWDKLSFLKAGVRWCDAVSTVSPTYAREIVTPEDGMGFDEALNERADPLIGIVNGIDLDVWNPATDPHLAVNYSLDTVSYKARNKAALQRELGLDTDPDSPLFCVVSRLTSQKGLDLLLAALPHLLKCGGQLALLGAGDRKLEKGFARAAKRNDGSVAAVIGYDEVLSHRMQAGADAIIVPSRFEPCGLTQLYGLRYGTLPVVAKVGGLADTVTDIDTVTEGAAATGFQFHPVDAHHLSNAIERACELYDTPTIWQRMIHHAMTREVGWDSAAVEYKRLYEQLVR